MENWDQPDAGMWEIRDEPRHHTTSLLMCWVAIERMMRMSRQRGLPGELARWAEAHDAIYRRIMDEPWDEDLGAFVQHRGSDTSDAGVLLMPMVKFIAPNDPRFLSTLAAIEERLVSDSLVFRYDVDTSGDGVDGTEAPSRSAPSGTSRPSPASAVSRRPGWRWRRCSPTPTTGAVRRAGRPGRAAARQLPAVVHPPQPDQRGAQPGSRAGLSQSFIPLRRRPTACSTSRLASRSASACRLSHVFLPRARAISTLARPSLK